MGENLINTKNSFSMISDDEIKSPYYPDKEGPFYEQRRALGLPESVDNKEVIYISAPNENGPDKNSAKYFIINQSSVVEILSALKEAIEKMFEINEEAFEGKSIVFKAANLIWLHPVKSEKASTSYGIDNMNYDYILERIKKAFEENIRNPNRLSPAN